MIDKGDSIKYANELLKNAQDNNEEAIVLIAQGIYNLTAGMYGTNEAFVEEIFNNADSRTLSSVILNYEDTTGSEDFFSDIINDFKDNPDKKARLFETLATKLIEGSKQGDENAVEAICKGIQNTIDRKYYSPEDLTFSDTIVKNADKETLEEILNKYTNLPYLNTETDKNAQEMIAYYLSNK